MTSTKKGRGPLRVEYRKTGDIKPSPSNTRVHSPEQIDQIARSIKENDWTKPIIIDEKNEILAGHGAWQAAQQLGLTEVPTIQRIGLTVAQKKAYRIADNRIAENSTWDNTLLKAEFEVLRQMGYDVTLTGFDPTDIDFILKPPIITPQDPPTPALASTAVTRKGDLWLLGDHRIICADSTKPDTYAALLEGRKAQCVFTDPPYGISYEAPSGKFDVIQNDELRRGQLKTMLQDAFKCAVPHTREDAGWYVWHASSTRDDFAQAMRDAGLVENGYIIWEKPGMVLGWSDYRWAHEPCFYAGRQGVRVKFHGDRKNTTIWKLEGAPQGKASAQIGSGIIITTEDGQELHITTAAPKGKKLRHLHLEEGKALRLQPRSDSDNVWAVSRDTGHGKDNAIHPTMKPLELARRALKNSTTEGEIVLDMFGGSCSTVMAAEQTARVGYAIELDPLYVDASVRRWQKMTGKSAIHATEKKTFEAVTKARAKA